MTSSAIQTPVFQAKISNIQNAYDSSFIYSAGVYTLKNSSGTTTFTVTDAGAVTAGAAAGTSASTLAHVINGKSLTIQLSSAAAATAPTSTSNAYYFGVGKHEAAVNSYRLIGFGYKSTETHYPAYIGFKETSNSGSTKGSLLFAVRDVTTDSEPTVAGECASTGAWTFPVSVSVTGTADVSGTTAALRTDGGCYVAKIMSAGTVTDRTPFPKDLQTAVEAVKSMEKLPEGEYDPLDKEKQLDHSKLHPYIRSGDHRDMSATVSCLVLVCQDLMRRLDSAEERIRLLEGN